MGAEPDFIPGIYNYCDRWCERCAYTSRCLQFQIESEETQSSDALRDFDALNARFWQDMGEALVQAMRLLREMAVQQGIDPEDLHKETVLYSETLDTLQRTAREHPCATAALVYSGMVNEWFAAVDELSEAEVSLLTDHPFFLDEHLQVIRHYQYFIYPKIVRAIEGRMDPVAEQPELQSDAYGTAKITLIALDRSLAAWSVLYPEYPAYEDKTLSILLHLDRLRRSLEVVFPAARAFVRPGFDA